ncbi:MAG: peptide ABC transporter permease [Comamonadaceae bacterium PBBC2]|nr:MAG: peptide ABC transporter permease [Comamonadaceae bacterium PBBC2]
MSATLVQELPHSPGVWAAAWKRLKNDRVGMVALGITLLFILMVVLAQVGVIAKDWQKEVGTAFAPPHVVGKIVDGSTTAVVEGTAGANVDLSDVDPLAPRYKEWFEAAAKVKTATVVKADTLIFGGDQLGRDVLSKVVKGAQVSITVGLIAAVLATVIGTVLGAIGGYFGGKAGDFLEWVYNVFTSIPYILLMFSVAAVLKSGPLANVLGSGVWTVIIILSVVGWTGIYRLVRAEYIKHRSREYVRAAEAIGASHAARMFVHILPNISHVVLVQLSLHVVSFIKAEVILSFLGLGVPIDMVSWGTMLSEAQNELVQGKWWQLAAATAFMATFVTAFALLTDALRDALDPKLR